MLAPGTLLSGRYSLEERIAVGGMGTVWRGTDRLLGREIAVKVLLPMLMSDTVFLTRFRAEARMLAALRHPGIVQVYDYGEDVEVGRRRLDYLVMEYVEGISLAERIEDAGRLDARETMAVVAQAAEALQVAHDAGIVHRDVKPNNLLIRPGGAVALVDFGVARSLGVTGITDPGMVLGSVHYMAPEQAEGGSVAATTDVYAVGAVAYYCLTGHTPYEGDTPLHVLAQVVSGPPPTVPAEVPARAAEVVARALERDPARRYQSAAALAEAARTWSTPRSRAAYVLSDSPPPRPHAGAAPFSPTPVADAGDRDRPAGPATRGRRRTTIAVLAAGVAVGVAGSVGVAAWRSGRPATRIESSNSVATTGRAAGPPGAARRPSTGPADNPYDSRDVCGAEFRVIDSVSLRSEGRQVGRVFLLSDASTSRICVTTIKTVDIGVATHVTAYVETEAGDAPSGQGTGRYYAGPVRIRVAGGACVLWGGSVNQTVFLSPPTLCDPKSGPSPIPLPGG